MTSETIEISALDHPIKSVTVFKSSKAEVNRSFSLDLKAGSNKIQISDLSSVIDTESVRVSGLGDARLFDVVCTIEKKQDADLTPDSPSEVIRQLEISKRALENRKRVLEQEAEFLVTYAQTLKGEHVDTSAMIEFLNSFVTRRRESLEAVAELEAQILDVARKIQKEYANAAKKVGHADGQVTIVLVATEDGTADIKLTYIVSQISWSPTYELHATTENGKPSPSVSLHYRARVTQCTGEDWTNAALILSTVASDTIAKSVPHLLAAKIYSRSKATGGLFGNNNAGQKFGQPTIGVPNQGMAIQQQQPPAFGFGGQQQQSVPSNTGSLFGSSTGATGAFGAFGAAPSGGGLFGGGGGGLFGTSTAAAPAAAPPPPPAPAPSVPQDDNFSSFEEVTAPGALSEPTTIVTESPLSVSYSVEGESTIPSDGVPHQVSVAILAFDSKVTHVCCPKIDARVYLQCEVKNTSDFRLLPGPVSVFLDDSYVSKTLIQDINPSDTFDCTLGTDAATTVAYTRSLKTVRNSAGTFAEVNNTTTCTNTIKIHNKHRFALPEITIRDVIPMSEDKRVKVLLRQPDGLSNAKDGESVDLSKVKEGLKVKWSPSSDSKGGEKEGRYEFFFGMDAGAKFSLKSQWEVTAPADLTWHEGTGGFN